MLTGKDLTIEEVVKVARDNFEVEISEEAYERAKKSRELIFELAKKNVPVYGLNRGVGANKDRIIDEQFFHEYNVNLVRSHCVAVGPEASIEEVRAMMVVRLNTLLLGCTGIQPEILLMYKEMLNKHVTPVVPERGSVGEADIACLSHIALAMIGEGEAYFNKEKMPASIALEKAGLKPVKLGPKDGLALVSSNALSAGEGCLVLYDVDNLVDLADMIYSFSLEAFRGNVSPLDENVNKARPFPGQNESAAKVRNYLKGSYLWKPNIANALQDPLCFRCAVHIHGAVRDTIRFLKEMLLIQINSSDDNPCVLFKQEDIKSCGNFEPISWTIGFEAVGIALSHLSKASCYRTIKLSTEHFTKLARFLTPDPEHVIAYGTIQKPFAALDAEIRHLANPVSMDFYAVAGEIEDHANNTPYVVQKTRKIVDNLYYILGIEAIHAAQAADLRKNEPDFNLGLAGQVVYEEIRRRIPFLDKDRNLTVDIQKAYEVLKGGSIQKKVNELLKS
ncbi:histidine ammonia-lyase [Thermosediminibacter litoriperuensis]|uniref:Histidine ammonia-lyase n=1 Tax=Thermosediminibacter litoriperuensis TaxID=291989 RepID=A0A5S5ANC5_9FIRM|nr:histidine ammonia-lyase [Thermosediminibacter litoriperuensis]